MLVVPGVIVLVTWLVAPAFGPLDGDVLLATAGVMFVAVMVVSLIPLAVLLWRRAAGGR